VCGTWVTRKVTVRADNCSAGSSCCWVKPTVTLPPVPSAGAVSGIVYRGGNTSNATVYLEIEFAAASSGSRDTTANDNRDLHLAGTGACSECCAECPFLLSSDGTNWVRGDTSDVVVATTGKRVVRVAVAAWKFGLMSSSTGAVVQIRQIRYAWEGYPQCALYNGQGGPDDHTGVAAAPFTMDVSSPIQ
jgi:hypothetical protein